MEDNCGEPSQYANGSPKSQKKREHVRFEEPSSTSHDENTPLLENADLEGGRQRQQSLGNPEHSSDHEPRSLKSLILRNLLFILLTCIFIVGTAFVCLRDLIIRYKSPSMAFCTSSECVLAAAELLRNLSPNYGQIDPCQDFHRYTCEGFNTQHSLQPDQVWFNTLSLMGETAQAVLRQVLESPDGEALLESSAEQANFQKLKAAYGSCMDEESIREQGYKPLVALLCDIEDIFSTHGLNGTLHATDYILSLGESALIGLRVIEDDKNPEQQIAAMKSPSLGLKAKQYYEDEQQLSFYGDTISLVFERLAKVNDSTSENFRNLQENLKGVSRSIEVKSLVQFEKRIAQVAPSAENLKNPVFYDNLLNYTQVESLLPEIPISYLLNKRSPGYLPGFKIVVESPTYVQSLTEILKDTPTQTVKLYFLWKAILAYNSFIDSDIVRPIRSLERRLSGRNGESERWRKCVDHVNDGLGWIASYHYVKTAFSEQSKDFGDQIILNIKETFVQKLRGSEWMTEGVQDVAIEKLQGLRQKIGYPIADPGIQNHEAIQEFYSGINITSGQFFANQVSMNKNSLSKSWANAGKPTRKDHWKVTALTVDAYYNSRMGEIVFPAGIMQHPMFYSPDVPQYLTYAAFGAVAGHELSHAFDNTGRRYDPKGRLVDWWDNRTIATFDEKTQCFVEQYSNFTVLDPSGGPPIPVNGKLCLGENIADAGGLSASFQTWKRKEEESPEQLLPGIPGFTKEQIFFLAYANVWCGVVRPEEARSRVLTDPHSPIEWRIKGTLQNSREFREAFNCPVKAPTCELW